MALLYFHFPPNYKLILSGGWMGGGLFYLDMPKSNTNTSNFLYSLQKHFMYFIFFKLLYKMHCS